MGEAEPWNQGSHHAIRGTSLNADAVFGRAFVAGVGEEVGWGAVAELVADTQLAAYIEADGCHSDGDGGPSQEAQGDPAFTA